MAYRAALIDRVFVYRCTTVPTIDDVSSIARDIVAARRRAGREIIEVSIIPPDDGMPSTEVREHIVKTMSAVGSNIAASHVVIEGGGFKGALIRSVATAISFIKPSAKPRSFHPSVDRALTAVCAETGLNPTIVTRACREAGVIADESFRASDFPSAPPRPSLRAPSDRT